MDLRTQLIRDEAERLKPYKDSVGKLTIGVGRNLDDAGISHEEAMMLLDNDIKSHTWQLLQALPWVEFIDEVRQAALINLTFNMGIKTLLTFVNTLTYLRNKKYKEAAEALLQSRYAQQVGDRAKRLAKQIELGVWQ